ncbi:MAG TPA: chemotaxis protein CheB [Polyangiaceae bacterium]|nr:chemotaxis protein CheB [Polyangiaceae bacterium]
MSEVAAFETEEPVTTQTERPTFVVGIGASAGGLEALESFFDNVPLDSGMAFVVVQHLSPDFKSLMDEILSRRTRLPVQLVEDGMRVEPNRVYLIPAKKEMIIAQGRLLLSDRGREQELSLPIDVFFRSLAQDCEARAVAVVLSGGGSDGSRGICEVHDAGGLVLVQDPETAQFDGMPRMARDAGVADALLAPQDMPRFLLSHAGRGSVPPSDDNRASGQGMAVVYRMLEKEFGIDFTHYKPSTVTRRIERRLQLSRANDIETYVRRLRDEHEELDVLYRDLLIGVTRFFRNEEAFKLLEERVLPELWTSLPPGAPLRVWVAGCATGEEVYSLAILLYELGQRLGERPVKIFATDVHRGSLDLATRALYSEEAVAGVSRERLERHFLRRGQSYQVSPEIRQMVVFALHNVIKDAPFTRMHLVSCRNMLIYLQPGIQQKVLGLFHFALTLGGTLFLGPSESPGTLTHDFETLDKHWRIYKKTSESRVQVDTRPQYGSRAGRTAATSGVRPTLSPNRYSMPQLLGVYDALLAEVIPPSLLVNDVGELVHVFGGASKFLHFQEGRQALHLLDLVDGELKTVLSSSLARVRKLGTPLTFRAVRVLDGDASGNYEVTVRPLRGGSAGQLHFLVSFVPSELEHLAPTATELDVAQVSREQMSALEAELKYTKENLQTVTEELESSNEELQAANEELLASNEELQSTNEELQSVNEELYSVNAEYQRKIADLTELANDMENLLASTEIGTVFLDSQLRIRNFTSRAADVFHLLPHDIGRPIENLQHTMEYPELAADFRRVLKSGQLSEKELRERDGRVYFARILPYRAKGAVDGVVLTLIDVTGLKVAEDALFHERYLLNSLLSSVQDAIYFKDARGRFIRANVAMAKRLGLNDARDAVGKTGFELPAYENALPAHQQDEQVLQSGVAQHYRLEQRVLPDGSTAWDLVTRLPLSDPGGGVVGIIGIFRDVTGQKLAEQKIVDAVNRRDQFLAMLSHELRNPLGAMVAATRLLQCGDASEARTERLVAVLTRQSQQMSRLLDDLLEVSRVTQDKIELKKRLLDLRPLVAEAAEAAADLMQSRQLELQVELASEPLIVNGDPARLQQVQANLLSNAAKYTQAGGHVSLSAQREGNEAVVRVRDDGAGISPALLSEVFELFVQSDRTLDRAEGGLGVGLTLVRGLVERHGGSVGAISDGEGCGSEFVVRLPLATETPSSVPPPESQTQAPIARAPGPALKVAIVEDNDDSRMMLCELLELSGFQCQAAPNGLLGVELIAETQPDVALVDIGLPEIDGLEVARRVRKSAKNQGILLIALTGYGQREDRDAARQAGFDTHLVKPIVFDDLLAMLRAHADKRAP